MATYVIEDVHTRLTKRDNSSEHFVAQIRSRDAQSAYQTLSSMPQAITAVDLVNGSNAVIGGTVSVTSDVDATDMIRTVFVTFGADSPTGNFFVRITLADSSTQTFNATAETITLGGTLVMNLTQPSLALAETGNTYSFTPSGEIASSGTVYLYPDEVTDATKKWQVADLTITSTLGAGHTYEVIVEENDDDGVTDVIVAETVVAGTSYRIQATNAPLNAAVRSITVHLVDHTDQTSVSRSFDVVVSSTPVWTYSQAVDAGAKQFIYNNRFYFEQGSLAEANGTRVLTAALTGGSGTAGTVSALAGAAATDYQLSQSTTSLTATIKSASIASSVAAFNDTQLGEGQKNSPSSLDVSDVTYTEFGHVFDFDQITSGAPLFDTGVYKTLQYVAAASGLTLGNAPAASQVTLASSGEIITSLTNSVQNSITLQSKYGIGTVSAAASGDITTGMGAYLNA